MGYLVNVLLILVGAILVVWGFDWLYTWFRKNRLKDIGGELTPTAFETSMRKAQIIDLREKKDFDAGHILGARNLPYTQLKTREVELRHDLPVYVYDETGDLSIRAAGWMKKHDFTEVYWLQKGYRNWSGKTKKKKGL
ncbi:rhodanese-like domain-containing protein [Lacticaseibacillus nasuensis]|uniref:Rhodanese-related sulfurtransferase n=1 Tax=Lacticaseibacillus nasuensis JCM 17158 TaxID=1291734 RepID=A0A0R1JXI3_9LACO|nr:rhodanese-like domain-containing protein [Lacticaseibacillus nasuensis]KRK73220.1 rhodanese-related sulfurtransferase [Lacticaseibacillus nasuensis JCM 17158]MCX2454772.1 rhodanese-like domain-containing protein [Lacticaseibacillus nasuensis]